MKELQIKVIGLDIYDLVISIQKAAIKILEGHRVGGESQKYGIGYYFSIIDKENKPIEEVKKQ